MYAFKHCESDTSSEFMNVYSSYLGPNVAIFSLHVSSIACFIRIVVDIRFPDVKLFAFVVCNALLFCLYFLRVSNCLLLALFKGNVFPVCCCFPLTALFSSLVIMTGIAR